MTAAPEATESKRWQRAELIALVAVGLTLLGGGGIWAFASQNVADHELLKRHDELLKDLPAAMREIQTDVKWLRERGSSK
jgi:hypothetical protein